MNLAEPEATALLTDLLGSGKAAQFVVSGASMRPFLAGGETVFVRRVRPAEIRRGDLLLCQQPAGEGNGLTLHRVVGIHRRPGLLPLIQTQGDGLCAPDPPVTEGVVLGRVYAILRAGPGAACLSLDSRSRRTQARLLALRQLGLWRVRRARAALRHRIWLFEGP